MLDRQHAGLRVHHEQDDVGVVDRGLGLLAHRLFELPLLVVEPAGVDERELAAAPLDG